MPAPIANQPSLPNKPEKVSNKELKKEALRQRTIVVDKLYPTLLKHAKSVKDAKNLCKTLVLGLDTVFQMDLKKYADFHSHDRLSTLNLKGFMNEGKEYAGEWELVEMLKDEKISTVKGLISGMEGELNRLTDKEELARPLKDLKTDFL